MPERRIGHDPLSKWRTSRGDAATAEDPEHNRPLSALSPSDFSWREIQSPSQAAPAEPLAAAPGAALPPSLPVTPLAQPVATPMAPPMDAVPVYQYAVAVAPDPAPTPARVRARRQRHGRLPVPAVAPAAHQLPRPWESPATEEMRLFALELSRVNLVMHQAAPRPWHGWGLATMRAVAWSIAVLFATVFLGSAVAMATPAIPDPSPESLPFFSLPLLAAGGLGGLGGHGGGTDRVTVCHVTGSGSHSLEIDDDALDAHLAHGDLEGACGESPPEDPPSDQVDICHRPDGSNPHAIRVDADAVPAHLAHGDALGDCAPAPGEPPVALFEVNCTALACAFDAFDAYDPDGSIVSYTWTFGDGADGSGQQADHLYAANGTYSVELTVIDDDGLADGIVIEVSVSQPGSLGGGGGGGGGGSGGGGSGGGGGGSSGGGGSGGGGGGGGGGSSSAASAPNSPDSESESDDSSDSGPGGSGGGAGDGPSGPGPQGDSSFLPSGANFSAFLHLGVALEASSGRRSHKEGAPHGENEDQGEDEDEGDDEEPDEFGDSDSA